jgi:uncharacterized protein (TIGR00255 family)
MTGFGRGEAPCGAHQVTVELRSVNHRFADVAIRLPSALQAHEQRWIQRVRDRVARGRVDATVRVGLAEAAAVDERAVARYVGELRALAARFPDLGPPGSLIPLLGLPGVAVRMDADVDDALALPAVDAALDQALDGLLAMRQAEGERLGLELATLLAGFNLEVDRAAERAALVPNLARFRLERRLQELLPQGVDPQRLAQEVAILADRADVTEEIARLRAHVEAFHQALREGGAVGRRLDFLSQELLREANTLGTKAGDAELAQVAVALKTTIEKLKEQVANLE